MMTAFRTSFIAAAALLASDTSANAVAVGLELALLVDVSGSVSTTEYDLQKVGYISAFQNPTVQAAIAASGGLAVTYIEWSGASQQAQVVGWTHVTDATSANAFAAAIAATSRAFSGSTAAGSAIIYATPLFFSNSFDGSRLVIDVSGDGEENDGTNTAAARNVALAAGITTINGLAIGPASLLSWYTANIIGGTNAFAVGVSNFADFEAAIERKLVREIVGTPTPAAVALFGLGLVAMGFARRR